MDKDVEHTELRVEHTELGTAAQPTAHTSAPAADGSIAPSYDEVVLGRRSIRGFTDEPVSRPVLEEIIELAMRSPSSLNSQPWNFYVITGEPLERIRQGNVERNLAGVPESREFRGGDKYQGVHRDRQVGIAKQLFAAMGIAREDKPARHDWVVRGFRQFDAPAIIIVTYDRELHGGDVPVFDCGAVATALVNAAWSRGLGCVINSQGIMQSPVVREHAGVAEDQVIMISIAIGHPDSSFPANSVVSRRKPVSEATVFVGFEDEQHLEGATASALGTAQ
ncbi:nitroreductase [Brevibacterium daeguense]|uniref:Nitroreductase n=1 Tax=Brevibacterium daeguense TaxID=909936 RepID=A0ABP8EI91_9MICO|nr:nitroreductase [Brevibacterium daeguense]